MTGKKDVGDEIEDEEQLLGLKGEAEPQQKQELKEEKDGGVEMQVATLAPCRLVGALV